MVEDADYIDKLREVIAADMNAVMAQLPPEEDMEAEANVERAAAVLGVAVYRLTWDSSTLLRRVDTDFVNASSISQVLSVAIPTAPSAVVITAPGPLACGSP